MPPLKIMSGNPGFLDVLGKYSWLGLVVVMTIIQYILILLAVQSLLLAQYPCFCSMYHTPLEFSAQFIISHFDHP